MHGKAASAIALLFTALLGCDDQPAATRPRGVLAGEQKEAPRQVAPTPPPPPPPAPAPSTLASPFAKLDPGALQRPVAVQDAAAPEQVAPPAGDSAADAGKPRDLSAELLEKLGRPADCLDLEMASQNGGRLTIVVVAEVMPSGRITRAQASAPNQPASALMCLEKKATAAGLRGPIPGAPLSVTTTIPIEVVSQPTQR